MREFWRRFESAFEKVLGVKVNAGSLLAFVFVLLPIAILLLDLFVHPMAQWIKAVYRP